MLSSIDHYELIGGPRPREMLRSHQRWMVELQRKTPYVLLGSYMGSGKTASVLTAIVDALAEGRAQRVLIVAPLLVAETTWPDEIEEWEHTQALSYEVITGTEARRRGRLRNAADIHLINRENLPWLVKELGDTWPYDWLVWDESSRLKAGKKRTAGGTKPREDGTVQKPQLSEFGAACRIRRHLKAVVELTGTPAPGGVHNLWGQIYLLDQGKRLGATRTDFERRWFAKDPYSRRMEPFPHSEKEIMKRVKDVMFVLKEEDYADLPPLVTNTVLARLPEKAMKEYRRFERTLVAEEYDVEAVNRGVLTNKLLQFANGSLYNEDGDDLYVHDAKLKALDSIVEEAAGQPILVAYSYQFDKRAILKRYKDAVVLGEDPTVVRRWNSGKIKMLLCHPASAGHGLNLQRGGNIAVWYGLNWSLELYLQLNKRLHRTGQTAERVFLHHIVAPGTVDEAVMAALQAKGATQDSVTDAVRVVLQKAA